MNEESYRLAGADSCAIAVSLGCNLYSWKVAGRDVLYQPAGFMEKEDTFFGGGNPILFPAVGRTWDRSGGKPVPDAYTIAGDKTRYSMPIHGILPLCRWQKLSEHHNGDLLRVQYELSIAAEVRQRHYPFDVAYRQTFAIEGQRLTLTASFQNRGQRSAPLAFGYHPYFALANAAREGVEIRLPCRRRLVLDAELLVPTGDTEPFDGTLRIQPDQYYDAGFNDVVGDEALLLDQVAGRQVRITFGDDIDMFVIYSPPGQPFVCMEPWTAGLAGYEQLRHSAWEREGAIPVLPPGATKTVEVAYSVAPI